MAHHSCRRDIERRDHGSAWLISMPVSRSAKFKTLGFAVLAAVLIYIGVNYFRIARQSTLDETRPADVIIVFGAAEYSGKPSPIYRARLEHALALYKQGLAPFIITTGGNGEDPTYSEGGVGREYLIAAGVPESKIIAETQGEDTNESAQRVAAIIRANRMTTSLVVSDGYHIYRIKRMMADNGVVAFGSPRPGTKNLPAKHRATLFFREVVSLTLWRLHLT
jgi:uncharacterized SAM-binding protein YcdF (DUF218 family)